MNDFVRPIDHALSYLRHIKAKDDYYSLHTSLVLGVTNMLDIEAQAARIYTREMFLRVRAEISREGKYIVNATSSSNGILTYELRKYGDRNCQRKVNYDIKNEVYGYECAYLTSSGIPCRHIFAAMKYIDMTSFPKSLVVTQWTMNARKIHDTPQEQSCSYSGSEETAHFGHMTSSLAKIAYLASKNQTAFHIGRHEMIRVHSLLLKVLEDKGNKNMEKNKAVPKYVELRNPLYTKTKGMSSKRGSKHGSSRK